MLITGDGIGTRTSSLPTPPHTEKAVVSTSAMEPSAKGNMPW